MPSTNKTQLLNLNKWLSTDKPKKDDFNSDNEKLDTFIKTHVDNLVAHITTEERTKWNQSPFVVGSYLGDGSTAVFRDIVLGFKPSWGIVFRVDDIPIDYHSTNDYLKVNFAMFSQFGCSQGVRLHDTGITVIQHLSAATGKMSYLNATDITYCYVAFK